MYTFYSSNILYIMFVYFMWQICKAVHYALDRIRNPLLTWSGVWWVLDCFGLKMVFYEDKGERRQHIPYAHCCVLREETKSLLSARSSRALGTVLQLKHI